MRAGQNLRVSISEFVTRYPKIAGPLKTSKQRARVWLRAHPRIAAFVRKIFEMVGLLPPIFVMRAEVLAQNGRHREAVAMLEPGLRRYPRTLRAHEMLVELLVYLQEYERALQACARGLEIDPASSTLQASLAVVLTTLRNTPHPEDLVQPLQNCAALVPQNFEVVGLLLDILVKLKRFREAGQACEAALRLDPEFMPAVEIFEKMTKDPAARNELGGIDLTEAMQISTDYGRLAAKNATDFLIRLMTTFYEKLGTDPRAAPLLQGLERFRQTFSSDDGDVEVSHTATTLIPFEKAWGLYQAGNIEESLPLFAAIFRDPNARRRAVFNPYVKVAVIRSGEIVGRNHDTQGRVDQAIATYREIMSLDHDSVIAGRLLVLLARKGDLRGAANLAEDAIVSRPNLYPRLPDSAYIAALKEEIARR